MGLAIAYSVACRSRSSGRSSPTSCGTARFPVDRFLPRLEIIHVLIIPAALTVLITIHLAMIMRQHHTQFPGPGRRERNVVGTPMWPAYALRSIGLLLAVAAVLFLLGGLIQINPIWQWGPYHPYLSENGAQPDWYIGWLIGALRLMPNLEPRSAGHHHSQPVLGRVAVPASCSGCSTLALARAADHRGPAPSTTCSTARATVPSAPRRAPPSSAGW